MHILGKRGMLQWLAIGLVVDNIVDSRLFLLNDGRITRLPAVSSHKSTAIDLLLVTPYLAISSR